MDKAMSNRKLQLYRELLECTNKQRDTIEMFATTEKEEDILPFFSEYFERWKQLTEDIETLNSTDNNIANVEFQDHLSNLVDSINKNVDYIQSQLQMRTNNTVSDLRGVRTQQKVLNAYYNLNSKDNVAVYFDEKK